MDYIWLGIVQRDPLAVGRWRNYKWKRSDVNVPSTLKVWENRYVPTEDHPEACGYFIASSINSRFHDDKLFWS